MNYECTKFQILIQANNTHEQQLQYKRQVRHTDPEHRLGFFECLTGSEELLAITACVQNIYKKN